MESIQSIKQRFEIIGNDAKLNRAIEKSIQVAPTDISVLVTGESGVGKESIPKIIHSLSHRKHAKYIAVNCGAIPEGTIDSELFGHEKGAFTGATSTRSGYFEVANGGTIFLDEVGELPLTTQVRLLEKFREDLYYRLSTVEINIPPLRERQNDIHLLFRKFASDFGQKYKMPTIRLEDTATDLLLKYRWPGNIRQLRNIAEQISVLEEKRSISAFTLNGYLPNTSNTNLPAVVGGNEKKEGDFSNEREILYKVLFDMKADLNDLKKLTLELLKNNDTEKVQEENENLIRKIYGSDGEEIPENDDASLEVLQLPETHKIEPLVQAPVIEDKYHFAEEIEEEETLSLQDKEIELIKKSLERNRGKRKAAAAELGISERTLYRKIKQYDL